MRRRFALSVLLLFACLASARAQDRDNPVRLFVDASEVTRKIIHAKVHIPVRPGAVTLYYPKWLPGKHSPAGPIADLADVRIRAGKKLLPWQRDEVDGYALHCNVPEGVKQLDVELSYLGSGSGISDPRISPKLAVHSWDMALLYPKGPASTELIVQANLKLPEGWKFGTSLPVEEETKDGIRFAPTSLELLIDSPVLCGEYLKKIRLVPKHGVPHFLVLAGDSEHAIDMPWEQQQQYHALVEEMSALFGCHHYKSYHFLLALSDHVPAGGLEHHESSDNRLPENALHDPALRKSSAALLSHELFHSWNGKYRRPASMIVHDFQEPHKTRLLWVYEGLTSYYDDVLACRSGLRTVQETVESWAELADRMNNNRGRAWRPLEDTSLGAHVLYTAKGSWGSRRRGLDYYDEGFLIWLEVDGKIRQLTKGKKSLDDFCRAFFGGQGGEPAVKGYDFEDVADALNDVVAYDWKGHLTRRVALPNEKAPLEGFVLSGWKLGYADTPTDMYLARETARKYVSFASSAGLVMSADGKLTDVIQGTPADKAGLAPGMKLVAVNGRKMTVPRLRAAVAETGKGRGLELLIEQDEFYKTVRLDYRGGARYPILERTSLSQPDGLADILRPRAGGVGEASQE